jgi:hypothetical protein
MGMHDLQDLLELVKSSVPSSGSGLPMPPLSSASRPPALRVLAAEPVPISRMRTLWLRMTEIYGYKWTSAYGEDAEAGAGETWASGLSGLPPRAINIGLSAALVSSDPWPPTLPQFRAMCLEVPSLAAVKLAVKNRNLSTPFMRQVWTKLDGYRLRSDEAWEVDRQIREAYELAREHVMQGGECPPAPAALIEQQQQEFKEAPLEVAEKHIAEIAARLHVVPESQLGDAS